MYIFCLWFIKFISIRLILLKKFRSGQVEGEKRESETDRGGFSVEVCGFHLSYQD